jgi:hypothetical protein
MSRRSGNGINQQVASHAYREDTDKNDQGHAFLVGDSTPLRPSEDDPATVAMTAPVAGEDAETCKTPKCSCVTFDAGKPNSAMVQKGWRDNTL